MHLLHQRPLWDYRMHLFRMMSLEVCDSFILSGSFEPRFYRILHPGGFNYPTQSVVSLLPGLPLCTLGAPLTLHIIKGDEQG